MTKQRKHKANKILSLVLSLIMVISIFPVAAFAEVANQTPKVGTQGTIWIVGDSTVSSFTDSYYYPRYGWGTKISEYLTEGSFDVQNLALSGRSSKSYLVEPEYQTLINGMKSGDYLLIGFGHNDEKAEIDRYTNPNGTYTDEGSFANSLYENYIKIAKEKGCTPILTTPIVRRTRTGEWTPAELHVTADSGTFKGGDYSQSVRDLGTAVSVPVVDMTTLTKNLYDELGVNETLYLHAWTSSKEASVDNTHTNVWGGKYNAYLVTKAIKELNVSGLSNYIIEATAPTKADTLVSNPSYVEPSYDPNLAQSELWEDYGIWKGSAFGDVGGLVSKDNHTLETDADGNMHIAVKNNKGKISSTADGLGMYYYKVPSSSTFKLSATAKINSFDSNNQVSFGLMARDDMYIDTYINTTMGDYVAAGPLNLTKGTAGAYCCFARKSGVLAQGGTFTTMPAASDVVELSIEGTSDGYVAKYGNEPAVSGGFDFPLTRIDPENVYVGMYAVRNADITFSNIKLIVDGVEVIDDGEPDTEKTDQLAPESVTGSYTGNGTDFTYTIDTIANAEYSIDNETWQASNVFTGIAPNSTITFYARLKETSTKNPSPSANTGVVTFAPLDHATPPTLDYTVVHETESAKITITPVDGCEYKFGDDAWSTSNSKSFAPNTTVNIQIRYAQTNTSNISEAATASVNLNLQEQAKPADFTLTFTDNGNGTFTAIIPEVANAEYSFDEQTFTSDNKKTDCQPETSYTGYVRYKAYPGYNASPVTADTKTSPKYTVLYTLTVNSNTGGTATGSGSFEEGKAVAIKATPNTNYEFTGWSSSNGGTFESSSNASTTFTMPNKNTTVTANFKPISNNNSGGGSSSSGGSSVTKKPITSNGTTTTTDTTNNVQKQVFGNDKVEINLNNQTSSKDNFVIDIKQKEISTDDVAKITETFGSDNKEVNTSLFEKTFVEVSATNNNNAVTSVNKPVTVSFNLKDVTLSDSDKSNLVAIEVNPTTGEVTYLGGRLSEDGKTFVTDTKSVDGNFAVVCADSNNYNQVELKINSSDVSLNGTSQKLEASPFIKNGTTFVPVRVISETLGANVTFDEATKTAIINLDGKTVQFSTLNLADSSSMPIIVNNRMLIPVRFVSEKLGANVNWFESDKTVQITKNK